MGKFDFDEMDSAMQNAESKHQYEQQTELLKQNIILLKEVNKRLSLYTLEAGALGKSYKSLISDLNEAATIKCPSNLKSLLDNYANAVCIDVTKKMNVEATKVVSRISAMEKRKALPESLFYVLMISAISFLAFFVTVCYLNYAIFLLAELWTVVSAFGLMTVITIGIAIYLTRKSY